MLPRACSLTCRTILQGKYVNGKRGNAWKNKKRRFTSAVGNAWKTQDVDSRLPTSSTLLRMDNEFHNTRYYYFQPRCNE